MRTITKVAVLAAALFTALLTLPTAPLKPLAVQRNWGKRERNRRTASDNVESIRIPGRIMDFLQSWGGKRKADRPCFLAGVCAGRFLISLIIFLIHIHRFHLLDPMSFQECIY